MEVNGEEEIKGCIHLSLSPAGSPIKGTAATMKTAIATKAAAVEAATTAAAMTAETAAAEAVATLTGQRVGGNAFTYSSMNSGRGKKRRKIVQKIGRSRAEKAMKSIKTKSASASPARNEETSSSSQIKARHHPSSPARAPPSPSLGTSQKKLFHKGVGKEYFALTDMRPRGTFQSIGMLSRGYCLKIRQVNRQHL